MFTFTLLTFHCKQLNSNNRKKHADNETSRQWHMNGDRNDMGVEEGRKGDKLQNSNIIFTQKTMEREREKERKSSFFM